MRLTSRPPLETVEMNPKKSQVFHPLAYRLLSIMMRSVQRTLLMSVLLVFDTNKSIHHRQHIRNSSKSPPPPPADIELLVRQRLFVQPYFIYGLLRVIRSINMHFMTAITGGMHQSPPYRPSSSPSNELSIDFHRPMRSIGACSGRTRPKIPSDSVGCKIFD